MNCHCMICLYFAGETMCRGKTTSICLYDLPGQHDFNQMRKFALKDSNLILICFDVQKRKSFDNVQSVWIPEIRQFLGKSVPIVLVGILSNKTDKRSVSRSEAIKVTSQMLLQNYFEIDGEDSVEVCCLFSYIASITQKTKKRSLSFMKRLFMKWNWSRWICLFSFKWNILIWNKNKSKMHRKKKTHSLKWFSCLWNGKRDGLENMACIEIEISERHKKW